MSLREATIAGRTMTISDQEEHFPPWAVEQSLRMLEMQARVFPKGDTWIGREYGVHTLLARVDCVVRGGRVLFYEGEDRPDGAGTTRHINRQFEGTLASIRSKWPGFRSVWSASRHTDDCLWLGEGLSLDEARACTDLLLVRARPEEEEFHELERRAVAPVRFEGCKRYGVPLNLWTILTIPEDGNASDVVLPEGSFVVKPKQGTRGRAIELYLTEEDRNRLPGAKRMSRGDVIRRARREGGVVCQPFIPAMRLPHVPDMHAIYRMYFGFDPCEKSFQPLGGVWMATSDPIVHGKEGAVAGPLLF